MRILFIHNHYQQAGGEDMAVRAQVDLLKEKGHEVEVMYFNNDSLSKKSLPAAFGAFYNRKSYQRAKEVMVAFKPDVVHVHNLFFTASPAVLFAAHKLKVPVVFTLHNYRLICSNAFLMREHSVCELCTHKKFPLSGIKHKCYRSSRLQSALVTGITGFYKLTGGWKNLVHTFIALTEFGKNKYLNSSLNLPEKKVVVVPNFISDPGEGLYPRKDFYLFVGRISAEKGVSVLLKCFADLPHCRLVLAGDGPEKEILEKEYAGYSNISFRGFLSKEEIVSLMRQCKALLFPSLWFEGLPYTIVEAFATGTPVIASRLGAMAEVVKDGYNGFHFKTGDPASLKECILRFSALTKDSNLIYSQARKTYLEKYGPDSYYNSIMPVYQRAITDSREQLNILGLSLHSIGFSEAIRRVKELGKTNTPSYVCFANVHMTIEAKRDQNFAKTVNGATMVLADGKPVAASCKLLYGRRQEQIAGPEFMPRLLESMDQEGGYRVFFFGSSPEVLDRLQQKIAGKYKNVIIAGAISPPFRPLTEEEHAGYIGQINASKANMVFVALGCPKQEKWMHEHHSKINAVLLGVGAAFPMLAGIQKRAPLWIRKLSMEWAYRLLQEPRRLFKRYLITNTLFVCLLGKRLLQKLIFGSPC